MYERQKKQGKRTDLTSAQIEQKLNTGEKIASLAGVGQATVRRAAEFAKAVDAIRNMGVLYQWFLTPLTPYGDIAVTNSQGRKTLILLVFSMLKTKMSL